MDSDGSSRVQSGVELLYLPQKVYQGYGGGGHAHLRPGMEVEVTYQPLLTRLKEGGGGGRRGEEEEGGGGGGQSTWRIQE